MRLAAWCIVLGGCGPSLPGADGIGDCAGCHPQQEHEFASSRHRTASTSPAFVSLRALAGANAAFCLGCHQPDGSSPGLTCLTCHAAIGNEAQENGRLVLDPGGPVAVGDATGLEAPHSVQATGFLLSSDLCATCHDVNGPGAFHEQPFESWQRSPAAALGEACQACHLSPVPGQAAPRPLAPAAVGAQQLRPHANHGFVGLGSSPADAAALLANGLAVSLLPSDGAYRLQVTNVGQGHHALSGAGFVRSLAATVEALDADGGATPLASIPLDVALVRAGVPEVNPLLADGWSDQGLDPGGSKSVSLAIPGGAQTLHACVTFAEVRPELAAALGLPTPSLEQAGCIDVPLILQDGGSP